MGSRLHDLDGEGEDKLVGETRFFRVFRVFRGLNRVQGLGFRV